MSGFAQTVALLRRALGLPAGPIEGPIDSAAVMVTAARHQIAPLLGAVAADPLAGKGLPADLRGGLLALRRANGERNRALRRQLAALVAMLNEIGIEPLLLKGAARLVDGSYADPAGRFMLDLDLLVPGPVLAAAFARLRAGGYAVRPEAGTLPDEHHHAPVLGKEDAVGVELHRLPGPRRHARLLPIEAVWSRARPVALDGGRARLLDPVDDIVHLVVHGQLQHRRFVAGGLLLKEIAELDLILRRAPGGTLQLVLDRAAAAGRWLPFATFLRTAELLLGRPLTVDLGPAPAARLLARRAVWQQDRRPALVAGRLLAHTWDSVVAMHEFPSARRRFPGRLLAPAFYGNRWLELRRLVGR